MSRHKRVWLALGLVGSYSIVTVAAGHGIAPAGLLLVLVRGADSWWFPAAIAGWVGVVLAVVSCRKRGRTRELTLAGAVLSVSAVLLAFQSEVVGFTFLTAVPFVALMARVSGLLSRPMAHAAEPGAALEGGSGDVPL
ncbi:MAG TPA: hypothetical protein VFH27_01385 [Longimicrobiaceae bacterium]|nr:hypothetical protein [Longimicrobiaceae bacterium]